MKCCFLDTALLMHTHQFIAVEVAAHHLYKIKTCKNSNTKRVGAPKTQPLPKGLLVVDVCTWNMPIFFGDKDAGGSLMPY